MEFLKVIYYAFVIIMELKWNQENVVRSLYVFGRIATGSIITIASPIWLCESSILFIRYHIVHPLHLSTIHHKNRIGSRNIPQLWGRHVTRVIRSHAINHVTNRHISKILGYHTFAHTRATHNVYRLAITSELVTYTHMSTKISFKKQWNVKFLNNFLRR